MRYLRGRQLARIAPASRPGTNRSPSLVRSLKPLKPLTRNKGSIRNSKGVTVVRGHDARRRWQNIIKRRKKFADWLAKRQADRRAGRDPS